MPSEWKTNYVIVREAKEKLLKAKPFLKQIGGNVYQSYKESQRILRKVKYN